MAPLLRRSWAPRGQTPILIQRTRSRDKASIIGVLSLSPRRRRVGLYFCLLPNENVTAVRLTGFLRQLKQHLCGPAILVWDRLLCHRAIHLQHFLARQAKLRVEYFPPYAPELNPVEYLWSHLKLNHLANYAAADAYDLAVEAEFGLLDIQSDRQLLRSFLEASPLFSRRR
jgi:transposase